MISLQRVGDGRKRQKNNGTTDKSNANMVVLSTLVPNATARYSTEMGLGH